MITILSTLRYGLVLVFGVTVSSLFSGVESTRANRLAAACFCAVIFFIQMLFWWTLGLQFTSKIYPIIMHLPLIMLLVLYFKRPWLMSVSSVMAAFLCYQAPRWAGSVARGIFKSPSADHICSIAVMAVVYYFIKRCVARSVQEFMKQSTQACLIFGAVPFLYYVFDYTTGVYSDLLYSGARSAVQFTPSLISAIYFGFVLLYHTEAQKQTDALRERDILATQFHQAQSELDTMRQMQESTVMYRHDMRHHLSLIGSFAAEGDIQKIKEYLSITEADINALTPVRYCENETVNLILSTFETRAKKDSVILCTDIKLPETLGINDTELCSLLSNALENALTATAQVMDDKLRKVYIHALVNSDKLVISTENAYIGKIEMEGELPKSQSNEAGHGFGIKSMVAIVERHGGLYSFETADGVFVLQLMLPLKKEMAVV
ncbi:sensor histidine kinase [Bacteroides sp.]|uniref:sensor histidine kinase n=1 Tax=Bacteroides sp. TaxID=29523 RepID=UPI0026021270|nr:ATP-binding protein [Bacteroides sp.]MDD3040854.1 ATP-binding protein [Bacteroides sp.]